MRLNGTEDQCFLFYTVRLQIVRNDFLITVKVSVSLPQVCIVLTKYALAHDQVRSKVFLTKTRHSDFMIRLISVQQGSAQDDLCHNNRKGKNNGAGGVLHVLHRCYLNDVTIFQT